MLSGRPQIRVVLAGLDSWKFPMGVVFLAHPPDGRANPDRGVFLPEHLRPVDVGEDLAGGG